MTVAARLFDLGLALPPAAAPVATYAPYVVSGPLVFVSGQLPMRDGTPAFRGKLGADIAIEQGQAATKLALLNVLAHVAAACGGDLERVTRIVRLGGFIACVPAFAEHPKVMNGASDLAVALFGDAGRHARATVGVASLPLDAAVEVEGIFEIR